MFNCCIQHFKETLKHILFYIYFENNLFEGLKMIFFIKKLWYFFFWVKRLFLLFKTKNYFNSSFLTNHKFPYSNVNVCFLGITNF